MRGYDHKQHGGLHYVCALGGAGPCLVLVVLAVLSTDHQGEDVPAVVPILLAVVAVLCMVLAGCFVHLHVWDAGDWLEVRFGPIGLFGTKVRYADIVSVQVGEITLVDGWGVHGLPGQSIVYNVWGWDCVVLTFRRPEGLFRFRRMKIGTDEPDALAAFLSAKLAELPAPPGEQPQ